jgi:ATP-binding cassette subfamily F protein uup
VLRLQDASASFGPRTLFSGLSLTIEPGDRLGLIGRNGSGKTTLLHLLAGRHAPESGERWTAREARIALVEQESRFPAGQGVAQVVAAALERMPALPHEEAAQHERRVTLALEELGFREPGLPVEALSGGWRKRLALACALVSDPDVVLLDEPTNHLDLEGILWLQDLMRGHRAAFVAVTHDRAFLDATATRVMELDPRYKGGLFAQEGNYSSFCEKREEYLAGRAQHRESLDNRVRREKEWLLRGPKARTTKDQGRIDEAHRMMEELSALKSEERVGSTDIDFTASGRKTRRLVVARGLGMSLGGRRLFGGLDLALGPGMRLGLVGGNGSGKTTLLRLLSGESAPTEGTVRFAERLQVVNFDQHRRELDPAETLRRALATEGDSVLYRGRPIHVAGWAARFGFDPGQLLMPVGSLSGGERARVQVARLMLRPADLLLLDEPTNDLDIATLEVLEESLTDFPGALVLVTHDRALLDHVCTLILGLDGNGGATFCADSAQWEASLRERARARQPVEPKKPAPPRPKGPRKPLTWKEERELEGMEAAILAAEERLGEATRALEDPTVASHAVEAERWFNAQQAAQLEVEVLYARWAELEAKRQG